MKGWITKIYLLLNRTFLMKNLYSYFHSTVYLFLLLSFVFVSCEQESIQDNPSGVKTQAVRLTACLEEETSTQTRTALSEDGHTILWTKQDQIKVFTKNNVSGSLFESLNETLSNIADFEGVLDISGVSAENPIFAVYPYSSTASFDGTSITTTLASEQVALADGFADHLLPAIAVSSNLNLSFYQVATGIRFLVSNEGVKKVIFRGNKGETVSGTVKVSTNVDNRPVITEVVNGSQWVTLTAPENGTFEVGKMYYLSVFPQNFENGFTLTFLTDTKAARFEFNNEVLFKRAIWKNGKNLEEGIVYSTQLLDNGVPIVEVNVQNVESVDSKEVWKECSVRIGKDYYDTVVSNGKIRGRGNATWKDYPKKPYRIKFSSKESPFGFPANKDWVLLAEFNDKSFLRLPYMCEVSKAADTQYTINYQHVNLYLNGEYQGLYILTDQVKTGKNRVNVEEDGFLIEEDMYYNKEPLWFSTASGFNFSFKYPDADDGAIVNGDDNYTFITTFFSNFESALANISVNPNAVSTIVDYASFAKWYLVQELLGNWEPNRFYVLESRSSKLKMYPAWDPEWSMGLARNDNPDNELNGWYSPPTLPDNEAVIWRTRQYFPWLLNDPVFISVLKSEWSSMRPKLSSVSDRISDVKVEIELAQKDNFEKWPTLYTCYGAALIALGSWEAEVDYVNNFFVNRINWMDNYLNALN